MIFNRFLTIIMGNLVKIERQHGKIWVNYVTFIVSSAGILIRIFFQILKLLHIVKRVLKFFDFILMKLFSTLI